jgi:hypothetical protein
MRKRGRKPKKQRLSREARSFIYLENLVNSPRVRAKAGYGQRRRPEFKGVPEKLLRVYTPDYLVFHRYCLLTGLTKVDALHDLMASLYERVKELETDNDKQQEA